MSVKVNRIGERNYNNFGSEMVIVKYRINKNIDVYFPEYNYTVKGVQYSNFKGGRVSCPYERRVFGVGYIGEGEYKPTENGKHTRVYDTWHGMLQRCYEEKFQNKHPTYINCEIDEDWLNFQEFGEWDSENYYEVKDERVELDKDILIKHNKIYSLNTCIYVPKTINMLFTKRQNDRGESCIGTSLTKNGKYIVRCNLINPETGKSKREYLGVYNTQEKAFEVYKYYKEKNIKEVADYYKEHIPQILYDVLYNYEVEIDD